MTANDHNNHLDQDNHEKHEITRRLTKNEKKRLKKKQNPKQEGNGHSEPAGRASPQPDDDLSNVEIEYVGADYEKEASNNPLLAYFKDVFQRFSKPEELVSDAKPPSDQPPTATENPTETSESNLTEAQAALSKRKKKLLSRMTVAQLKQVAPRPDVVEAHDVSSSDPKLLVYLKAYRNTVPVPRHWCHIRKYLQGKRGVEKIPFQLPEYIAETGIAKIRETVLEQEALKKGKQKARDRVRPKMGKIDIDYQVLHDAFFKYQTKPKLTSHGDLYYEGKEFEVHVKEKKPGLLSAELKEALGMQEGSPPPWLINMQRYGPPPSYAHLRIPGLNAPLPPGASYGYQPGGWGKPPVDEYGRPLYGDVFGTAVQNEEYVEEVDKTTRWGAYEIEEEVEESEEEEEEEEEEEVEESGTETPYTVDGSLVSGLETPDTIDLRKRAGQETPQELYTVMQEKKSTAGGQVFGSDRVYAFPTSRGDVQLSLDPDQLEEVMKDKGKLKEAYDASLANKGKDGIETEDDAKGGKKRKAGGESTNTVLKKVKEFKF